MHGNRESTNIEMRGRFIKGVYLKTVDEQKFKNIPIHLVNN
jgi:hypothetical protein